MEESCFFCPDTQFLVAFCFYDEQEAALLDPEEKRLRATYKKLKETEKMITFECHRWDFYNKVANTQRFLHKVVLRARRNSKNSNEFRKKILDEIKNNPIWDRYRTYVRVKLPYFSQFAALDESSFIDIFHEETEKYSLRFINEISSTQFNLSSKDPLVLGEYEKLVQIGESIRCPQPRDLKLLASCIAYCKVFLPEGFLLMVTEDRELRKFAELTIESVSENKLLVLSANDLRRYTE